MQPVSIAMIGVGNFAATIHLPNLHRLDEFHLRALCDLRLDHARQLARRFGADYATDDVDKVLSDDQVELVLIGTREDLQVELAVRALAAGKHVYVEKPLAHTPEECRPVLDARQKSGKRLAVGFNRRFAPVYARTKELLSQVGGCYNVHFRHGDDMWRWGADYPPGSRISHDIGHLFDLMRWFTDSEIETVYCVASRPDDDAIVFQMASGCVVSILNSGHGTMDMPKERMDIITRRGGIVMDDFVEVRTYGYRDLPHRMTFAGHTHPDREFMHKYLYEHLGHSALQAVCRMSWELRESVVNDELAGEPHAAEIERYVARTIPNFMLDKGWMECLRQYAIAIREDKPSIHAGAEDAVAAAAATHAAVTSRQEGRIVRLQE